VGQQERGDRGAEHLHRLRQPGERLRTRDLLGEQRGDRDPDRDPDAAEALRRDQGPDRPALHLLQLLVRPPHPAEHAAREPGGSATDPAGDASTGLVRRLAHRWFGGRPRVCHTARHTVFGLSPASSAWVTVRPPRPAITCSRDQVRA
jgi:hypothetical protein